MLNLVEVRGFNEGGPKQMHVSSQKSWIELDHHNVFLTANWRTCLVSFVDTEEDASLNGLGTASWQRRPLLTPKATEFK